MRHVLIAGLWALGLMAVVLVASRLLSLGIPALVALFPGMLIAEILISILPRAAEDALITLIGDGRLAFACMSVIFSFLFWWASILVLIKLRARWLKRIMP
ncbi:MAG: hypothetical protein ACJ741_19275 [Pyrinomonadaceae bacterium]